MSKETAKVLRQQGIAGLHLRVTLPKVVQPRQQQLGHGHGNERAVEVQAVAAGLGPGGYTAQKAKAHGLPVGRHGQVHCAVDQAGVHFVQELLETRQRGEKQKRVHEKVHEEPKHRAQFVFLVQLAQEIKGMQDHPG